MKKLHCLASSQDFHPNMIHLKLLKCGNQGNVKPIMIDKNDEVKIMSHTHHQHQSPDGTLGGQSSKSKKYCDVSPNRLYDDGGVGKDARNHDEQ